MDGNVEQFTRVFLHQFTRVLAMPSLYTYSPSTGDLTDLYL
jgi:hypothetical protein